jgi:hypothetical protein
LDGDELGLDGREKRIFTAETPRRRGKQRPRSKPEGAEVAENAEGRLAANPAGRDWPEMDLARIAAKQNQFHHRATETPRKANPKARHEHGGGGGHGGLVPLNAIKTLLATDKHR